MEEIARHDFAPRARRLDGDRRWIDDQLYIRLRAPFPIALVWLVP